MTNTNTNITVPVAMEKVGKYAELMNITVPVVAELAQVKWTSKPKKAVVLAVLTKMEDIYRKRKELIDQIVRYEGGEADITMTRKELRTLLTDLQSQQQEEEDMTNQQQPVPQQAPVVEVPQFIDYKGVEFVQVGYTQTLIEQAIIRTQQEVNAVRDQELAAIETKVEEMSQTPVVETPVTETPKEEVAVEAELTDAQIKKAIAELEAKIEECRKEEKKWIARDMKKYFEQVNITRKLEEKLHELKGGDVQQLIKEKYNGFRTSGAKFLANTADVTEKYGHKGVDKGAELLNSIFDGVMGITKDVVGVAEKAGKTTINIASQAGHVGVDAAAGVQRAAGDIIGGNTNK